MHVFVNGVDHYLDVVEEVVDRPVTLEVAVRLHLVGGHSVVDSFLEVLVLMG